MREAERAALSTPTSLRSHPALREESRRLPRRSPRGRRRAGLTLWTQRSELRLGGPFSEGIAQPVRAGASHAPGRRRKSSCPHHFCPCGVVQSTRLSLKQEITGAKPVRDANFCRIRGACVFWLNSVDWSPSQRRFGRSAFYDLHRQLAPGIRHDPNGRETPNHQKRLIMGYLPTPFRFVAASEVTACGQKTTALTGSGLLRGSIGLLKACRGQPRIKSGSASYS